MSFSPTLRAHLPISVCTVAVWLSWANCGWAQLEFTEVMHTPLGASNLWEWVEVYNTSSSPIDLDGWYFDDDDDVPVSEAAGANIKAENGNTVVPAGGVAVLYAGSDLGYMPSRFTNAWGPGITLIPVRSLTTLTDKEQIGLWPNRAAYDADDLGPGQTPRRSFTHAAVSLDYQLGFPQPESGHSIAWKGTGDVRDGANWVQSRANMLQATTSVMTTIASAPINGSDRGNPGRVPAGAAPAGLRITEVMFDPDSTEPAWEWVEVYNNTGATIDFSAHHYVLHDDDGKDFSDANITSGALPQGGVGVLFNAAANSLQNMQAAWGSDINFIPVSTWGNGFGNSGDTVAIWSNIDDYDRDSLGTGRTTDYAVAALSYEVSAPWPTSDHASSIYLKNLGSAPEFGDSWVRSGTDGDTLGSSVATPVLGTVVDHPGGDVGSPGYAPGASSSGVLGDYNGNHVVDAADYTVWRDHLASGQSLLNDASPGGVTIEDYNYWKAHYGATSSGGASGSGGLAAVPEPASALVAVLAATLGVVWFGRFTLRRSPPALR